MAKRERFEGSAFNTKIVSILCVFLLVGCGSGGGGGGNNGGGEPSGGGGPSGIGPNGGTASSSDGRASVTIPAGALSQDTAIAVAVASNPPAGNIGTAYDFGPDGTTFSQPVAISITYDDAALPAGVTESNLRLGTVANNQWEAVTGATVDTVANVVSGTTTHFSVYGVIAVSDSGVVPAAPTGVRVAAGDGQVTLTWALVPDATSYNVYMASQSGVTKSNYGALTGGMAHTGVTSPFVHTGLINGTTYYFVVTAVNATGESTESSEGLGTPVPAVTIPSAPSDLQATAVSTAQINLTWTDHAVNEDGFKIERKTGAGGTYSQIATVGTSITKYSDTTGLAANTTYCYHVRAFNGVGPSTYSNESCATTPPSVAVPSAPTLVTATPGDGQITIGWNAVSGATSYNLYLASQSGVTKSNYTTLPNGTKQTGVTGPFTTIGLTNGTTYYVVVTAVNASGESSESSQVSATPQVAPVVTGKLNDTGITASQCYQAGSDVLVACSSAGAMALNNAQDGMAGRDANVATNSNTDGKLGFSFASVAGGCVQDNVTGLMWEVKTTDGGLRDWNNGYTNYDSTTALQKWNGTPYSYVAPTQAEIDAPTNSIGFKNSVNVQGLCGYSDWRLPTADELQSIVDYSVAGVAGPGPTIDATWFPNTQGLAFWSASPEVGYSGGAWYVFFFNGDVTVNDRNNRYYVRLVRAGQSPISPRYTVSADGQEVTDNQTKLIWRRCSEGMNWDGSTCAGVARTFTHEAALQRATAQASSTGIAWRLPDVKELASIADKSRSYPAIDPAAFPATPADVFWSASPYVGYSGNAWVVHFVNGYVNNSYLRRNSHYVRLVRAGQ